MSESDDLVKRVTDELAIRNLLGRIAQAADEGTLEEYVALWTEDGSWEVPDGAHRGHDAIRARAAQARNAKGAGPGSGFRHVLTNQVVNVDGSDTATSEQYMILINSSAAPIIEMLNHHRDTFRRTPGGWKLARRQSTTG